MVERIAAWILANPDQASVWGGSIAALLVIVVSSLLGAGTVRQRLLALMLRAERARRKGLLGPVDGPAVMDWVINQAVTVLVPRAPMWIRPWLTANRLRSWAERGYELMMDILDDGQLNGTRPAPLPDDPAGQVAATLERGRPPGVTRKR